MPRGMYRKYRLGRPDYVNSICIQVKKTEFYCHQQKQNILLPLKLRCLEAYPGSSRIK